MSTTRGYHRGPRRGRGGRHCNNSARGRASHHQQGFGQSDHPFNHQFAAGAQNPGCGRAVFQCGTAQHYIGTPVPTSSLDLWQQFGFSAMQQHSFVAANPAPGWTASVQQPSQRGVSRGSPRGWRGGASRSVADEKKNWRGKQRQARPTTTIPQNNPVPKQFLDFPFLIKPDVIRLMKEFKVMMILRGLPGSGKSTVAAGLVERYGETAVAVCSADRFRYNRHGEYVWSKDMLQETHEKCQRFAKQSCDMGKPIVAIDNTNVEYFELKPYIQLAKQHGYIVVLVEPRTPWKLNVRELQKRNTHDVSFKKLAEKVEKFEDINPLYFGWFLSPKYCTQIKTSAVDILKSCLKISHFRQWLAELSEKGVTNYSIGDAIYYYYMSKFNELHVTSCFSPRGRQLGHSSYSRSQQVLDSLGHISTITVIGWVLTENTFSGRVSLTKQQQKLWNNKDITPDPSKLDNEIPADLFAKMKVQESMPNSGGEICLKPNYGPSATTHITVGVQANNSPVQAKHDIQVVVDNELGGDNCPFTEYRLDGGTARNYHEDDIWVVYLNQPLKGPAIFSGYYD